MTRRVDLVQQIIFKQIQDTETQEDWEAENVFAQILLRFVILLVLLLIIGFHLLL